MKEKTILVVEDNEDLRSLLCLQLNMHGYNVLEADNGQRAIEMMNAKRLDLILMDISMPVLDGIAATRIIRQRDAQVPIVACSAFSREYRTSAIAAGCNDFVEKPIDAAKLINAVGKFLGSS